MSVAGSDLLRVLARLEADEAFFEECGREIRSAAGDEAILAFMRVAARHGYRVTFHDAKAAARHALSMRPVGERRAREQPGRSSTVKPAKRNALSAAVSAQSGGDLKSFLKQW